MCRWSLELFFLEMIIVSYMYENIEHGASALFTCTDYHKTFRNVNESFWGKLFLEKIIFYACGVVFV